MTSKTLKVSNVSCGHCTGSIERELNELPGVIQVKAELDGTVRLELDEARTPLAAVEELLREINYPPQS